jgi:hypothetical protein
MISGKMKFVSAAVAVAALIATVSVARTVHTRVAVAGAQAPHGSAVSASRGEIMHAPLHGSIACGALSYSECERLEMLLPE